MKNFLLKNWKNILLLILIGLVVYMCSVNRELKDDVIFSKKIIDSAKRMPDIEQPKVEQVPNIQGTGSIVKQEVIKSVPYIPESAKKAISESYLKDTIIAALKKANNVKDITIKEITRAEGEAKGKLTQKDLLIAKYKKDSADQVLEWQGKYLYAKGDFGKKTLDYAYKIDVDYGVFTETSKGILGTGILKKKTDYQFISSRDSLATFNGMTQVRFPIQQRKDAFNLSVELGGRYFLKPYNQLSLFSGIRGTINPDGSFRPSISGGYILDTFTGKVLPIVEASINFRIFER